MNHILHLKHGARKLASEQSAHDQPRRKTKVMLPRCLVVELGRRYVSTATLTLRRVQGNG